MNIVPPLTEAKWFRLVGVPLGNGTELYPTGDDVQTVEQWPLPNMWAGISSRMANLILDDIDKGMPDGEVYSDWPRAKERAAWKVMVKHVPEKEPGQAKEIIKTWVKSDVLVHVDYDSPSRHETAKGLKVAPQKRPS